MRKAVAAAMSAGTETLYFLWNVFISYWKCSFMWVQDCYKKGKATDSNMVQDIVVIVWQLKAKSEGEGLKLENLMPAKDGLIILKRMGLKSVKIGEAASAARGSRWVPRH